MNSIELKKKVFKVQILQIEKEQASESVKIWLKGIIGVEYQIE